MWRADWMVLELVNLKVDLRVNLKVSKSAALMVSMKVVVTVASLD